MSLYSIEKKKIYELKNKFTDINQHVIFTIIVVILGAKGTNLLVEKSFYDNITIYDF